MLCGVSNKRHPVIEIGLDHLWELSGDQENEWKTSQVSLSRLRRENAVGAGTTFCEKAPIVVLRACYHRPCPHNQSLIDQSLFCTGEPSKAQSPHQETEHGSIVKLILHITHHSKIRKESM